jgi:hypothetical protein
VVRKPEEKSKSNFSCLHYGQELCLIVRTSVPRCKKMTGKEWCKIRYHESVMLHSVIILLFNYMWTHLVGKQSTMERFLKRKPPPIDDDENPDGGTSRRDDSALNINQPTHRSSRIARHEVNFDELPYDPADRRRISDYIGQKLQDDIRRKYLIRGPFKPPPGFKFPEKMIAGFPRRCQANWFTTYHWLEYSEKVDKCFCLYCYLFRDCNKGQGGNDAFVINGWDGWNKSERLRDHVGTKCNSFHNTAMKRCDNLLKPGQSIGAALNKLSNVAKEQHLIRLRTSIKAVRYLLNQGLAFRGHDESEQSTNKGNFRELVKLLAEENDKVKKAISTAPKNSKMIAPEIQRDIANCYAEVKKAAILFCFTNNVVTYS